MRPRYQEHFHAASVLEYEMNFDVEREHKDATHVEKQLNGAVFFCYLKVTLVTQAGAQQ